jgi:HEAT repeat protein
MRKLAIPFLVLAALLMHSLPSYAQDATERRVRTLLKKILAEEKAMEEADEEEEDFDDSNIERYYKELDKMGRSAVPTALKIAREHDNPCRYTAFEILAESYDGRAVPLLIKALEDPDDGIRAMAVVGLSHLADPQAIPALIKVLKTDKNSVVRTEACKALGAFEATEAIDLLIALVVSEGKRKKELEKKLEEELEKEIMGEDDDEDEEDEEEDEEDEEEYEDDEDGDELRVAAISVLGELKAGKAVRLFVTIACDQEDDDRLCAIEALAAIGSATAALKLIPLLKDKDVWVRLAVVKAMMRLKHKKTGPPLVEMMEVLESKGSIAPLPIYAALAAITKKKEYFEKIATDLSNTKPAYRLRAIKHLGETKHRLAYDYLLKAYRDEKVAQLRQAALAYLVELGDPRAYDLCLGLLKDKDNTLRLIGVMGLGEIRDRKAYWLLFTALRDKDLLVRLVAIEALMKLGDRRVVPKLIDALEDPEGSIRVSAYKGLQKLTGKNLPFNQKAWRKEFPR